jgi:eukaryotic-like serine/threonine-protein kinase
MACFLHPLRHMQPLATIDTAMDAFAGEISGRSFLSQSGQFRTAKRPSYQSELASERGRSRIGSVVAGRWCIERLIGVGGMAVVYAATHRNGQRVALKFLRSEFSASAEARERFLTEALIANRLGHPGITRVSDDGITDDGSLYLVMELLEGQTLEEHLNQQQRLPLERIAYVLTTLLDVLEAAHNAGILHRDIKPGNIFLCSDGSVRVLDFGVARVSGSMEHVTMLGVTVGTPAFMSPEQAGGCWDKVDARSDLFSVGATGYALLTGENIRDTGNCSEELVLAMTKQVPSVGKLRPDLSAGWVAVIDYALRLSRDERFDSAAAMRAALASCTPGGGARLVPAPAAEHELIYDVNRKHSVAAWHTDKPAGNDTLRPSLGRWWRVALAAALCVGMLPFATQLRLDDREATGNAFGVPNLNQPQALEAAASVPSSSATLITDLPPADVLRHSVSGSVSQVDAVKLERQIRLPRSAPRPQSALPAETPSAKRTPAPPRPHFFDPLELRN